jgi:hypothetical protein
MVFKYRFVGFGTTFSSRRGDRSVTDGQREPAVLYENELAVDVGGVCWGYGGEDQPILDHHFTRPGQFPSASAAVLHNAERVTSRFAKSRYEVIWLVTHVQPDFDALCAAYLARSIITDKGGPVEWAGIGINAAGWVDVDGPNLNANVPRINWFDPDLRAIPAEQRWRILLAAAASITDHGRRISCPRNRALHSVLYAALKRGRDYLSDTSGATEFFDRAKDAIQTKGLNPIYDSVLEEDAVFAPERALLDREIAAYERDMQRCRKAIVFLQQTDRPFGEFYSHLRSIPLLDSRQDLRAEHLASLHEPRRQTDGVYIRDPECLLFKEWARVDTEHSSLGEGFLFTAVAYSGGRPDGHTNHTDYFFAIDPERADGRHLYGVWAQLQAAEVRALHEPDHTGLRQRLERDESLAASTSKRTNCRANYEHRAGPYASLFDDPWYDGSNYECTIVATPNRGTLIAVGGVRGDLLDDPVVAIVRRELESSIYKSEARIAYLPASRKDSKRGALQIDMAGIARIDPPPSGHFTYVSVRIDPAVNLVAGMMAEQIGRALWGALHPDLEGVPSDFLTRHLLINPDWLGVWSRRGVAIAYKEAAAPKIEEIERTFESIADLAQQVEDLAERLGETKNRLSTAQPVEKGEVRIQRAAELVDKGEVLIQTVVSLRHRLVLPDNRVLSRFLDAIQLGDVLDRLRDINLAAAERARNAHIDAQTEEFTHHTATVADVQTKVEWLEVFIVGFYATELSHIITSLIGLNHHLALRLISGVGFTFTIAAALALTPWKHRKSSRGLIAILVLLVIVWIAGLIGASVVGPELLEPPGSSNSVR